MSLPVTLAVLAALFLALPWLAIVFRAYCDAVNRFVARRRTAKDA